MKLKSMISWALIFSFTLLLFQPLAEAKRIESAKIKAQIAELSAKYQRIDQDLKNYQQKNQAQSVLTKKVKAQDLMFNPDTEDMSAQADESGNGDQSPGSGSSDNTALSATDPVGGTVSETIVDSEIDTTNFPEVGVIAQAPDQAPLGSVVPILVAVWIKEGSSETIDKINISVQESSGKTSFKDSFINYKNKTQFSFGYSWDTELAQTVADSGGQKHKIIVEAYQKKGDQYLLFQQAFIKEIEIVNNTWDGLSNDIFWNNYVSEDGSLSESWLKKLDCKGKEDCKDRKQVQDHLEAVIATGGFAVDQSTALLKDQFNDDDFDQLLNALHAYQKEMESKKSQMNDEELSIAALNVMAMSDLISFIAERIDEKRGYDSPTATDEMLTSPEMYTVLNVVDKYQVKMASYDPQTKEELTQLPFWANMEKDIRDNIAATEENQIKSVDELKIDVNDLAKSSIRPEKASAVLPIAAALAVLYVAGIAISGWDLYQSIKNKKGAWDITKKLFWVALAAIPGGSLVKWGGWLTSKLGLAVKIAKLGAAMPWIGRAAKFVGDVWSHGGYLAKLMSNQPGLAGKIGKGLFTAWEHAGIVGKWLFVTLPGVIKKKLIDSAKVIVGVLRFFGIVAAHWWSATDCPNIKIMGGGSGIDPFAWALCNMLKFFFDLGASIYGYANCLLKNALGIGTKPTQCEFKIGPTS